MKKIYFYLKENLSTQRLLESLGLITLIVFYNAVKQYFNISLVIFHTEIKTVWIIIVAVLLFFLVNLWSLLKGYKWEPLMFLFWGCIIIGITLFYITSMEVFFVMDEAKDYLYESEIFSIKIEYTRKYLYIFLKNYFYKIYPRMTEKYKNIELLDFNWFKDLFEKQTIDFWIPHNVTLSEIKKNSIMFLENYIKYKLELHEAVKSYKEWEQFYKSAFYQLIVFSLRSIVMLMMPYTISKTVPHLIFKSIPHVICNLIPARMITLFYRSYLHRKAIKIAKFILLERIENDANFFPAMTPSILNDLSIWLGGELIRIYGYDFVYCLPWFLK